ncbi:hypothetical protein Aduo_019003 [Ancylostoma duodenale]
MTTQSVLHALRRFIATIGCPTWIVCDNALSFRKVAECYSSLPNSDIDKDIIDYSTKKRIQVKFIPSLSPWQGGIYEKMIVYKRFGQTHTLMSENKAPECTVTSNTRTR